jgi:hypothetical protein
MMRPFLELIQGYIIRMAVQQKFHFRTLVPENLSKDVRVKPISD